MTLAGRFGNTTGRPYIEGKLYLPRLSAQTNVSFLIDTGADLTTLMPADSNRMGLDYARLQLSETTIGGIGGVEEDNYTEPAMVVFQGTNDALYCYALDLRIMPDKDYLVDMPSLLGRDILQHWIMTYAPPTDELTMQVKFADHRIPIETCVLN